jgi:hypothetical protein
VDHFGIQTKLIVTTHNEYNIYYYTVEINEYLAMVDVKRILININLDCVTLSSINARLLLKGANNIFRNTLPNIQKQSRRKR